MTLKSIEVSDGKKGALMFVNFPKVDRSVMRMVAAKVLFYELTDYMAHQTKEGASKESLEITQVLLRTLDAMLTTDCKNMAKAQEEKQKSTLN